MGPPVGTACTAVPTSCFRRCRLRLGPRWIPEFLDYLYTSFTNATAFSPTDTMPLTAWAKLLMMLQSLASLITVAVVVSAAPSIFWAEEVSRRAADLL